MKLDRVSVRRHRWMVITLILVGALNVMLAAGSLFLLRQHVGEVSFDDPMLKEVLGEVDYRMTMGGFTVLTFALGLFLFFIAVVLDISLRQKAIILFMARQAAQQSHDSETEPEQVSA